MFERSVHVASYLLTESMCYWGYWKERSHVAKNLYISKIPLRGEEEAIINFVNEKGEGPLGCVVSVVKPYEVLETLPRMDPIRPDEWKDKHIQHILLEMPDFTSAIAVSDAFRVIQEIQAYRQKEEAVLVHCKAGRSRSALMVACVLAIYDLHSLDLSSGKLVDLAIAKISENRHIRMEENRDIAVKIVAHARRELYGLRMSSDDTLYKSTLDSRDLAAEMKSSRDDLNHRVNHTFADDAFKSALQQMSSYKNLVAYRDALNRGVFWTPKRVRHLDLLIDAIGNAKDCGWYVDLLNSTGVAALLLHAAPYFTRTNVVEDADNRKRLIMALKEDVEKLLSAKLGCGLKELTLFEPRIRPMSVAG